MQKLIKNVGWSPSSYKQVKPYLNYFPHDHPVFKQLSSLSPIVSIQRIQKMKQSIEDCENHKSSLLHIGDCAQPFQHSQSSIMSNKISFLKKCRHVLENTKNKPVHVVGRIAGQYAKPRSSQFVQVNGVKIHNYKGDNINSLDESDRQPCHKKLMQGYKNSLDSIKLIDQLFPQLFVSHEGLVVPYEQSLTKQKQGKFYCQSAHMIWIGQRTRQIDGAHVQFFRGLQNPIGVKISSNIDEKLFLQLVQRLNPQNKKGKLLVIVRMGKQKIKQKLSNLIKVKQNEGLNFLFVTDPMHGNTFDSSIAGVKTRNINHIVQQIKHFQQKMKENKLNYGYSLQATFQDVTECFGVKFPERQEQISKQLFKSKCDPRLNKEQTLKLLQILSA